MKTQINIRISEEKERFWKNKVLRCGFHPKKAFHELFIIKSDCKEFTFFISMGITT